MRRNLLLAFLLLPGLPPAAQHLYSLDLIKEIRIHFEEPNWDILLDSLKQEGNDDRLLGEVTVNGTKYEGVGLRYKGNSSYFNVRNQGSSKLPFNIKINYKKKDQVLPGGYTSLKLSNLFRDPGFLREVLAYEIAGKYMPAPKANFAKVYVNDRYLGLYNSTESVDDLFLDQYFGDHNGTLFKCDPNWHAETPTGCPEGDKASLMYLGEDSLCYMPYYELQTDYGWSDMIELTRVLNQKQEALEDILDIDQTLWMLAFNNVLVNLDSYSGSLCHNYYLYKDTAGIHHPVLWDMNLCFGGFRHDGLGSALSNEKLQTLSPLNHYKEKNPKRPLITNLLDIPLYRKIYLAHIRTILEENFRNGAYLERALAIQALVDTIVQQDTNRLYTYESFKENLHISAKAGNTTIIGLEELMAERTKYLADHPLINTSPPTIAEVKPIDYGEILAVSADIKGAEKAWLFYRYGKTGAFKKIEMFDDGGHNDELEKDGIWGATIDSKADAQFYLVAEGEKTAALSPERASMEFYEVPEN